MAIFRIEKNIATLPGTLTADTVYAVRAGAGFDLYITESTASVAYKVNTADLVETGSALTYTSGVLTRIDYESGNYKMFSYTGGVLTQLDYVIGLVTTRKTFNYNPDGSLSSVAQEVI